MQAGRYERPEARGEHGVEVDLEAVGSEPEPALLHARVVHEALDDYALGKLGVVVGPQVGSIGARCAALPRQRLDARLVDARAERRAEPGRVELPWVSR